MEKQKFKEFSIEEYLNYRNLSKESLSINVYGRNALWISN